MIMALTTTNFSYPVATPSRVDKGGPEDVVREAFVFQDQQNAVDAEWVLTLGVDRDVTERILTRLGQRGACWLDFVTIAAGYDGDFTMITDEMLDKSNPPK
ncbi:hypothetical protein ABT224_03550 [Streptomyces sp. NPDC001584]|uniref:hypothetical protein n=1 Tax=Streptomyces sp. NPDC001584 TaxID=3154521 RepID=UPI0033174E57